MQYTIKYLLQYGHEQLLPNLLETNNSFLEAKILLEHASGLSRTQLVINSNKVLSPETTNRYFEYINRRKLHEPIAYITGKKEFFGLEFKVTPDVLIPRADSECVVETALKYNFSNVLELGVGSGCLILSILANSSKNVIGTAVDISEPALKIAKDNYESLKIPNKVEFIQGDWGKTLNTQYDLIISNPPYISTQDISTLDIDVKNFEPSLALDGGYDGLNCYRILAQSFSKLLLPGGTILLEIGINQENLIETILDEYNFQLNDKIKDLSGITRCLVIQSLNR